MSDGGKGSKPRPFSISHQEWVSRWDAIFARDQEQVDNDRQFASSELKDVKQTTNLQPTSTS